MKLYAVIPDYSYEGYGKPIGIFDNLNDAKSAIAHSDGDLTSIFEYEINQLTIKSVEVKL